MHSFEYVMVIKREEGEGRTVYVCYDKTDNRKYLTDVLHYKS